jgi:uncharacterized membrane protein SpoIIM required for sporulation
MARPWAARGREVRASAGLKSVEFRREREATWKELERLVERVEAGGIRALGPSDLARLPVAYRATLSSLSVARAISLDRALLDYLESLAARGYFCVYGTKQHPLDAVSRFVRARFPGVVRGARRHVALAAALLVLGAAAGLALTRADPEHYYALVSDSTAQGRNPSSSSDELRRILYGGGSADALLGFALFLFTHNAQLGLLCASLGFAAGVPTFFLLFWNGLQLGALAALYHDRGLGLEFWAWVLPHGVTELLAIVLCAAGGLVVAESLLFPGRFTRLENLALRGRDAGALVIGATAMFFLAGLVEGIFRQTVTDVVARLAVTLVTGLAWTVYFVWPRPAAEAS